MRKDQETVRSWLVCAVLLAQVSLAEVRRNRSSITLAQSYGDMSLTTQAKGELLWVPCGHLVGEAVELSSSCDSDMTNKIDLEGLRIPCMPAASIKDMTTIANDNRAELQASRGDTQIHD